MTFLIALGKFVKEYTANLFANIRVRTRPVTGRDGCSGEEGLLCSDRLSLLVAVPTASVSVPLSGDSQARFAEDSPSTGFSPTDSALMDSSLAFSGFDYIMADIFPDSSVAANFSGTFSGFRDAKVFFASTATFFSFRCSHFDARKHRKRDPVDSATNSKAFVALFALFVSDLDL